jgi:hypothetical protein
LIELTFHLSDNIAWESFKIMKSILDTEDPLTSKRRFLFRAPVNWALSIMVFAPLLVVLMQFTDSFTATILACAVVGFLYFSFWNNRAINIRCPACARIIKSNTPWICSIKGCENRNTDDYPFVYRCEHCSAEPKSYICHHRDCGVRIFLSEDENEHNFATCMNMSQPAKVKAGQVEEEDFNKQSKALEYRLHLANLQSQVDSAERKREESRKLAATPEEKIKAHREKRRAQTITAAKVYREERAAIEKEWANDLEMQKMLFEELDDWYEKGDWERLV